MLPNLVSALNYYLVIEKMRRQSLGSLFNHLYRFKSVCVTFKLAILNPIMNIFVWSKASERNKMICRRKTKHLLGIKS